MATVTINSTRTKEEQDASDEFHRNKCCTSKLLYSASCILFVGIILIVTAAALFDSFELEYWADAQYKEDCYITADQPNSCTSVSCTADTCSINTYSVSINGEKAGTCADGECPEWDNGCVSWTFTTECTEQREYETGDRVACYSYSGTESCVNTGRLDPDDEWIGNYTSYLVLLIIGIIFMVLSLILYLVGIYRCICKRMEDEILGERNGTGCYFCCDYERMCYGEGTGHATIHNPQGKNLPGNGKKRVAGTQAVGGSIDSYEEEQHVLR